MNFLYIIASILGFVSLISSQPIASPGPKPNSNSTTVTQTQNNILTSHVISLSTGTTNSANCMTKRAK
jgi:hypothetical protein